MGYNTTILILNDGLEDIRKDPVRAVEGIHSMIAQGKEGSVGAGNHANPIYVMQTQHADVPRLYFTHGNSITELSPYSRATLDLVRDGGFRRDHVIKSIRKAEMMLKDLKRAISEVDKETS